jgi:hypothetical protein
MQQPAEDALALHWTTREVAVKCLRKYFFNFVLGLKPNWGSTPLRYGSTWHAGMEAFYRNIQKNGWAKDGGALTDAVNAIEKKWEEETVLFPLWNSDYRTKENCLQSLLAYINHFAADEGHLKVIEVERFFRIPITPTEQEQERFPHLEPFWFEGRIDLEVFLDGRYWQMDHKTTGQNLTLQASRLQRSGQAIGYTFAGELELDQESDGHLIVLHHLSAYKSKVTGEYGKPKIDFSRIPMLYDEFDVADWMEGSMEIAQRLQIARRSGVWPMEHGSCYTYGRCAYCDLCESKLTLCEIIEKGDSFENYHLADPHFKNA